MTFVPEYQGRVPLWRIKLARIAAVLGILGGAVYLFWRSGHLAELGVPGWLFVTAESVNYLVFVLTVVLIWRPRWRRPPADPTSTLDVFVTVCGEDVDMVEATLIGALDIEYPHNTYVLNDGRIADRSNWREIEALCRRLGVPCFTRTSGSKGKAGNLNFALPLTSGEVVVVIDADHLARPDLADFVLGWFEYPGVALVTTHQQFQIDAEDRLGHREALFYQAIQPAKDADNAAFSCGNGAAYSRRAIESLGGFSEWNLVEDLHTSYELHARGWHTIYQPTPVTIGTAPDTAAELVAQRLRWATDSARVFFWDNPLFKRGLSPRQRLHYLHTTGWYLAAASTTMFLVGPIASILFGVRLLPPHTSWTYAFLLTGYLGPVFAFLVACAGVRATIRTVQLQVFLAPVYLIAVCRAAMLRPGRTSRRTVSSGVTEKSRQRRFSKVTSFQHALLALLAISIGVGVAQPGGPSWIAVLWACAAALALATQGSMISLRHDVVQSVRIAISAPVAAAAVLVALAAWSPSPGSKLADQGATPAAAASSAPTRLQSTFVPAAASQAPLPGMTRLLPPKKGIYLGAFNSGLAGPPRAKVKTSRYSGAKLRIIHRFQAWWGNDRLLSPQWLRKVARAGAVPMVSWEPWRKPRAGVSDPYQRRGLMRQIARGKYDGYIARWARDAARFRKPMMMRLMHEMNGSWYPWSVGQNGNTPKSFKAAWRRIHDLFVANGATNVSWVWSIDSFAGGPPTPYGKLRQYYPGSDYVDWVALSGFNWGRRQTYGGWLSLTRVFERVYPIVVKFGKPIMISETGTTASGGSPAAWVTSALRTLPRRFKRVKAIVWYDGHHPAADFRLSRSALRRLRKGARRKVYRPALNVVPAS